MRVGIFLLVVGYMLSQFYRAFLAVLSPVLQADLGATPASLATSSGLWFLSFALMQMPVGWALDRFGPRRTVSVLLLLGGGLGALTFSQAQGPGALHLAMVLIGIGCSPVLMGAYYIFGRVYSPKVFGTLAGAIIGFGSLGNILSAAPLSSLVTAAGWRETLLGFALFTAVVAVATFVFVRDPEPVAEGKVEGSIRDLLRIPGFWAILVFMAVAYAPAAAIRGLWAGPWLKDISGPEGIGTATLVMGLAMVAGNFFYGPLDRWTGSKKWGVFWATVPQALALLCLALWPAPGYGAAVALLVVIGFFGASFPAIMAHGRAFLPPHLLGRGVTFINMFGIAGAGLLQTLSGRVHAAALPGGTEAAYAALFWFFLLPLAAGMVAYLFSRDVKG